MRRPPSRPSRLLAAPLAGEYFCGARGGDGGIYWAMASSVLGESSRRRLLVKRYDEQGSVIVSGVAPKAWGPSSWPTGVKRQHLGARVFRAPCRPAAAVRSPGQL